jgi:hypothetical protein
VRRFVYIIDRLQSAALSPALSRQLPPASVASIRDGGRVIAWDDSASMPAERRVPGTLSTERQMPWGTISENGEEYPVTLVWWTDWLPTPEELARRDGLPGFPWRARNETAWTVPLAMDQQGRVILPNMQFIHPGAPEVLQRHTRFHEAGRRVYAALRGGQDMTMGEATEFVIEGLRINYHVGRPEIAALELFYAWDVAELAAAMAGVGVLDAMQAALGREEKKIRQLDGQGATMGEGVGADGGGALRVAGIDGGAG